MNRPSLFDLSETVAVVTGGTRGIGRAITLALVDAGADVVPTSRTQDDVDAVVDEIRNRGADSLAITTDVTDENDVQELFSRTISELDGIDTVVNNAGINPPAALGFPEDIDREDYEQTLSVNLLGTFDCARAAAEHMDENDGGSIINVASVGGVVGLPRQHPYVASKHGVVGITKSMALDWAPEIRVNAIAPGYVSTELTEDLERNDRLRQSILDRTPLDRFADPEEIAGPAVFLASDAATYITGACLTVDGGWTTR